MKDILKAARGDIPCDLLIENGRIANVLSLEYEETSIAVHKGTIVGIGRDYVGVEVVDARGAVLMPGMIDGHLHIESTMLTPEAFASAVLPLGTTTVLPDPHEIANTCGMKGVEYMWKESQRAPLDMYFGAPSCVPASNFETSLEEIDALGMAGTMDKGWCTHMGEMMNYLGVIRGDTEVWSKITLARNLVKTGHMPGVTGKDLCAYLLSGCDCDHECDTADEAREKLRRGAWLMLREGATARNLRGMAPVILEDESRFSRCLAVSDDLTAGYILKYGHMDHKVRTLIETGIRPLIAAAMVTINPAQYFRLWDRGALAPGRIADIVMVDSLESCRAIKVWKNGLLVAENGNACYTPAAPQSFLPPPARNLTPVIDPSAFKVEAHSGEQIRVIEVLPGSVVSMHMVMEPTIGDGMVIADPERDIAKMVVVEKNRGSGRVAIGFATGFGMKRGAFASSVAHDAHNFIAIGVDDDSIAAALRAIAGSGGGLATASDGQVNASFPLPIGGLMSDRKSAEVARAIVEMESAVSDLGVSFPHPFMALSFLSLSVIPELKLTDAGYVDLGRGGIQGLFA